MHSIILSTFFVSDFVFSIREANFSISFVNSWLWLLESINLSCVFFIIADKATFFSISCKKFILGIKLANTLSFPVFAVTVLFVLRIIEDSPNISLSLISFNLSPSGV